MKIRRVTSATKDFDVVLCNNVLQYVESIPVVLRSNYPRPLKSQGVVDHMPEPLLNGVIDQTHFTRLISKLLKQRSAQLETKYDVLSLWHTLSPLMKL